jgi:hypothetical protein
LGGLPEDEERFPVSRCHSLGIARPGGYTASPAAQKKPARLLPAAQQHQSGSRR